MPMVSVHFVKLHRSVQPEGLQNRRIASVVTLSSAGFEAPAGKLPWRVAVPRHEFLGAVEDRSTAGKLEGILRLCCGLFALA